VPRFSATLSFVLAVTVAAPGAVHARDSEPHTRFVRQAEIIEDAIARLSREFANPLALIRQFPFQGRLIDARVFYELGNYEHAAVMLLDVLENPAFQGNLELEAAQLLLGKCLLRIDNVKAAHRAFVEVTRGRDMALAEEARFHLIELALSEGSEPALRELVAQLGGRATSDRTRYGLGKAYLQLGDIDQAILWLQVIGPQSEFFAEARYYLGVAYTANKDYQQALSLFQSLAASLGDDPERTELVDLTWLALGRLQVEMGQMDRALTNYQRVGRQSPHYEVALYEMAWAYITFEQYDRALLAVDILLLTVEDEQIDVDAHVLRGRLNVMMNDYEEAMSSYSAILDRFAPIRNELVRFSRDPTDIQRYFQWLLERRSDQARLTAPLTERTSRWVESTDDIGRVARVFDRISAETEDIAVARAIGQDLEKLLAAQSRVELFPNLRDGWTRALVLENRLVLLLSAVLDAAATSVRGRVSAEDAAELAELIAWRRNLEDRAKRLPQTFEAYDRRQAAINERFLDLSRKHFLVEQGLEDVKRQLLALERYLDDQQFADFGEKLPPDREEEIRADIELEKRALQELFDELTKLKRTIEIEARSIGTGDATTAGESTLKRALLDAFDREGAFYDRVAMRVGGPVERDLRSFADLRSRIVTSFGRIASVVAAIDEEVAAKTAEIRGLVNRELGSLAGYATEAALYDAEGRDLARDMGEDLFRRAQDRMNEVVLEADVGILDVVWERKQQTTASLTRIAEERAARVRSLQADLEALRHGAADDPLEATRGARPGGAEEDEP